MLNMNALPLISVIVPIYNVKPYLAKCVKSIFVQSYRDIEILLVDDGSTDGSGALADELAAEDVRATVFHKENGGLSDARNFGLDVYKRQTWRSGSRVSLPCVSRSSPPQTSTPIPRRGSSAWPTYGLPRTWIAA